MSIEKKEDIDNLVNALQKYIDELNETLIKDIPKEIRETNKHIRDLLSIVGDINVRLAKR